MTPTADGERAGIVTFHVGSGVEDEQAAWAALRERGIQLSLRYGGGIGGLRAGVHYFNDETDVERLVEALATLG